jgi:3-hydroxybutyryl-CoA dehydrogenase
MGPFELIDLIGVDVNLAVARSFHSQHALARWAPHPIQEQLVAEGRLGRKRGRGFYSYEGDAGARDTRTSDPSPQLRGRVLDRLLATLVNEACFAAGEGVAARSDIDLAMRLGLNHPRGPFEWGTRLGPGAVVATLEALAKAGQPDRYVIAPELTRWARAG